jgi:TetR/AcrR family transcriptional regulator, lmrAB and yxaGH operons repressor
MSTSKSKMIFAALDLLRRSGIAGASIGQVIGGSGAPVGSLYHHFPGGKLELVRAALKEAESGIGAILQSIFGQPVPLEQKVKTLFSATGRETEANAFAKSCPVAAVTLDINEDTEDLREVCQRIFQTWHRTIAAGLAEVPTAQRLEVAELIITTLEGALIVSRAAATKEPLMRVGAALAEMLAVKFPIKPHGRRSNG